MTDSAPSGGRLHQADRDDRPPHGLSLETFAEIAAEIAEGDRDAPRLLEARGLTVEAWLELSAYWNGRMAAEMLADDAASIGEEYTAAFMRAQDRLKPVPAMTPEEWAALVVEGAHGDLARALASRGLSRADYLRLSRHWSKALARERSEAKRYDAAYYALQARIARSRG